MCLKCAEKWILEHRPLCCPILNLTFQTIGLTLQGTSLSHGGPNMAKKKKKNNQSTPSTGRLFWTDSKAQRFASPLLSLKLPIREVSPSSLERREKGTEEQEVFGLERVPPCSLETWRTRVCQDLRICLRICTRMRINTIVRKVKWIGVCVRALKSAMKI